MRKSHVTCSGSQDESEAWLVKDRVFPISANTAPKIQYFGVTGDRERPRPTQADRGPGQTTWAGDQRNWLGFRRLCSWKGYWSLHRRLSSIGCFIDSLFSVQSCWPEARTGKLLCWHDSRFLKSLTMEQAIHRLTSCLQCMEHFCHTLAHLILHLCKPGRNRWPIL